MLAAALVCSSLAFIVYVLFGYPLLLAAIARRRARPVRKGAELKTVTIILPIRNGEEWVRKKLNSILLLNYPRELLQVIAVSDGSRDRTEEYVREFAPEGVELVSIGGGGKAAAINAGLARARGEILFFTDVRQVLEPASLRNLVACFADPSVGAVSGELIILDGRSRAEADVGLYWRYEKWIRKNLSAIDSIIGATGCIYAMRRELAQPLAPGTLLDDVNLPLGAFLLGYRVVLDETAKAFDQPSALKTEFRRKLRTLAGVYQTTAMFPALLGAANRMWIHFFSHKVGRLLLPYALLVLGVASFGLPGIWRAAMIAGQAAFYGLALLDVWIPEGSKPKRLSSPVRTFVVLMAAAFLAPSVFLLPARFFWKEAAGATARPLS